MSRNGHLFFDLANERGNARISCVQWSSSCAVDDLKDAKVEVDINRVDFYAPSGRCQAVVAQLNVSETCMATDRAVLVEKLRQAGHLDHAGKRAIPYPPNHVCILTSYGSAACHDMLEGVRARWPSMRTTVIDVCVQGKRASHDIPRALQMAQRLDPRPDVIICSRGGGSANDLDVFNSEAVAMAIVACPVAVVSAVGHETDHTVADVVADLRCKTPTAAIDAVVPTGLEQDLDAARQRLRVAGAGAVERIMDAVCNERVALTKRWHSMWAVYHMHSCDAERLLRAVSECIRRCATAIADSRVAYVASGNRIIDRESMCVAGIKQTLVARAGAVLERAQHVATVQEHRMVAVGHACMNAIAHAYDITSGRMHNLSPHNTLKRGFAVVCDETGTCLTNSVDVASGDQIYVRLADGSVIHATVKRTRRK